MVLKNDLVITKTKTNVANKIIAMIIIITGFFMIVPMGMLMITPLLPDTLNNKNNVVIRASMSSEKPHKVSYAMQDGTIAWEYYVSSEDLSPLQFFGEATSSPSLLNQEIKKKGLLWKAKENKFTNLSSYDLKKRMGVKFSDEEIEKIKKTPLSRNQNLIRTLPDTFDWRNAHGQNFLTSVKDQGACGSCWAFAALGAMEGQANAYYNNISINNNLGEQDLISCYQNDGCNGLNSYELPSLFSYLTNPKVCTEQSFPYTACDAMGYGNCSSYPGGVPCSNKASNWQQTAWGINGYNPIALFNVEVIKQAIVEKGPVMAGMLVYSDFMNYEEGIYQHVSGGILGGHAVIIVGYGTYDGLEYWVVKNSWGADWGEDGYFRIAIGDDSGLESSFIYTIYVPNPPIQQEINCTDADNDNYCFWGLTETKPANCPVSCEANNVADCDDSNATLFENCGENTQAIGVLNIASTPAGATVYIKDSQSNVYYYRGVTPIVFNLNVGQREIKLVKQNYYDYMTSTNIIEGQTTNLNVNLIPETLITTPLNNDVIRAGDNIQFEGSIATQNQQGNAFQSYSMQYGLGQNPTIWNSNGFTLVNGGTVPIQNGVFATWNTSFITSAGFYTIRLRVNFANGEYEYKYVYNLALDPTLKAGWPVRVAGAGSLGLSGPVVSDLDHDGHMEIIVLIGGTPGKILVYRDNGELFWQANFGTTFFPNGNIVYPVIGDLNNDGYEEIVVYHFNNWIPNQNSEVHVFDHLGNEIWWVNVPVSFKPGIVMADLNQDGNKEIVIQENDGWTPKINILSNAGQIISQWEQGGGTANWCDNWQNTLPAIGNFDDDPDLEIVTGRPLATPYENSGSIAIYNMDGTILPGWPVTTVGAPLVSIVAGDVNNDSQNEIVATLTDWLNPMNAGIVVYNKNGAVINGWPQMTDRTFPSTPSLGRFLGESAPRIGAYSAFPINLSGLRLFDHLGSVITGWPQYSANNSVNGMIFADVNNDGFADVVMQGWPNVVNQLALHAWNDNGSVVAGFPKAIEDGFITYYPAIKDIDNDGQDELIAASQSNTDYTNNTSKGRGSIYVWELNSTHNDLINQWPEYQHDPQHTGYLAPMANQQYQLSAIPTSGSSPLTVDFTLTGNYPFNSQFIWHFGDNEIITTLLPNITHIYNYAGNFSPYVEVKQGTQLIGTSDTGMIMVFNNSGSGGSPTGAPAASDEPTPVIRKDKQPAPVDNKVPSDN